MKGQASVEFMFMIMSATAMTVIFSFVFSEMYQDGLKEKQVVLFKDFGESMQREFLIAAYARQGYERKITLPEDLEGYDYSIVIDRNTMILSGNYTISVFIIPETSGSILKGDNIIRKINDSICINC